MKIMRGIVVAALALLGPIGPAAAQEKYPSRPIDFICTWGTGGGADAMARQIGSLAQPVLGVALPVSNVPGASGNTGMAQLLASKPDGPFKTIQDLFKHAQANPGKLRVAATGFGTVDDVTVRFLEKKGYKMTTVPYPKPGERYAAALGGHAEVLYEQAGDVLQYLKAGQLKPLIIFAEKRHPAFPDVPSSRELGLDLTLPQFRGIVARKGTPPERIKTMADSFRKAMDTPQWKKFAEEWYFWPDSFMGPEQFGGWVAGEVDTLDRLVKEFGLRK